MKNYHSVKGDAMNTYNSLINNLEALELHRFRENIDTYLDMIASGEKTALDALYELTNSEMDFRKNQAIQGCVKVANFPYLKENLPLVQIAPVNIFAESAKAVFGIARHINLPFLLRTTDLESDIHLDHL